VSDLAKFVSSRSARTGECVKRATLRDNFSRSYPTAFEPSPAYGVGFMMTQRGGRTYIGHGGAVAGYSATADFDPKSRMGIVILRNASDRSFGQDFVFRALAVLTRE
jgi:CubicO group peptidase (beta-lactamase class C family)